MKKYVNEIKNKKEAGITLITLTITIIVLLILAGITITALSGDNGILKNAARTKKDTETAALEEKIKLLMAESIIDEYTGENEEKTAQKLQDELNKQGENVLVIQWDKYIIFDLDENKEYRVMSDGSTEYWGESTMGNTLNNITDIDSTLIGQDSNNRSVIGIDSEGNQVNMNFWECMLLDNKTYALNDEEALNETSLTSGYIADEDHDGNVDIIDGAIKGTIPQYLYVENDENWIAVTDLTQLFRNMTSLTIAPEIPNTVTNLTGTFCDTDVRNAPEIPYGVITMNGTFGRCYNLEIPPEIPDTVKDMTSTFYECSELTEMPKIPDSVVKLSTTFQGCKLSSTNKLPDNITNMYGTFMNCSNLVYIENLPKNVENMQSTFNGCSKLKDVPDIPSNVQDLSYTFEGCTSLSNAPKILSNKVTSMQSTFSRCSSITTAPEIPQSVENMHGTFEQCTSLVTPPRIIPSNVKTLAFTFYNCSNLEGEIQINANINGSMTSNNVTDYHACFYNACTNGKGLTILETSETSIEMLNKLKDNNPNIVIQN